MMDCDSQPPVEVLDAHEIHGKVGHSPVVVICEHASNRVPPPLTSVETDLPMLQSHWGWDIGVREVGRQVVQELDSVAVMARFSRLVCDANRDPLQGTFIRSHVENHPLSFNQELTDTEIDRRIEQYHTAYHRAVNTILEERRTHGGRYLLLSIHSFTPVWGNGIREIDFGVLFSGYDCLANQLAEQLRFQGNCVALNQPYSAANGMAYSVERHGRTHGLPFLELEINQACIGTPQQARNVGRDLTQALKTLIIPDRED